MKPRIKLKLRLAEVIRLRGADIEPEGVLLGALRNDMRSVVVAGYDCEGKEYFASSHGDAAQILWLLERMRCVLLGNGEKRV